MHQMDIKEVEENFEQIIKTVEKNDDEIIVTRYGIPLVKISPYENEEQFNRVIGIAKGKFKVPDDIDECNDEIARMFGIIE